VDSIATITGVTISITAIKKMGQKVLIF